MKSSKKLFKFIFFIALLLILTNLGCISNSNKNENSSNKVKYWYNININTRIIGKYEIFVPCILDDNGNPLDINHKLFNNTQIAEKKLIKSEKDWAIKIINNKSLKMEFNQDFKFTSQGHFFKLSLENNTIKKEKNDQGELIVKYWIYFNSSKIDYINISIDFNFEKSNHIQKTHISGNLINGWNQIEGGKLELID